MKNKKTQNLTFGSLIAASYIVLTIVSQVFGLASGPVQFRLSEALTILPVLVPSAVPGLTVGCILANIITGCPLWDIVFGSLATLIGAVGTYYIGKKTPHLSCLAPIISNSVIVPMLLKWVYGSDGSYWYFLVTVFIGEAVCAGILGILLYKGLKNKIKYLE